MNEFQYKIETNGWTDSLYIDLYEQYDASILSCGNKLIFASHVYIGNGWYLQML